jgi:hypothetical protein
MSKFKMENTQSTLLKLEDLEVKLTGLLGNLLHSLVSSAKTNKLAMSPQQRKIAEKVSTFRVRR